MEPKLFPSYEPALEFAKTQKEQVVILARDARSCPEPWAVVDEPTATRWLAPYSLHGWTHWETVRPEREVFTYTPDMARPHCPICNKLVEQLTNHPEEEWEGTCPAGHTHWFQLEGDDDDQE